MKSLFKSATAVTLCLIITLSCAAFVPQTKAASFSLNAMFGNDMVLQRRKPVNVTGTGEPGETVSVKLFEGDNILASAQATVEQGGSFKAVLPSLEAGGPYLLSITCGETQSNFTGVMVGEVWIALGQSNMAMSVGGQMDEFDVEAMENYNYPDIRFKSIFGGWEKGRSISPGGRVPGWYNVAVHFAKTLYDKYKVPVGVIQGAEGAVSILTYLTLDMLNRSPALPNYDGFGANYYKAGYMFNKTVANIYPFTVQGVLWYQGETDCGDPRYPQFMERLITCYRELFQDDITFLMTQLPSFYEKDPNVGVWHYTRERMQKVADTVPGVGIAITTDILEGKNIHPGYKNLVGQRLAGVAMDMCYGGRGYNQSPAYQSHTVDGKKVTITFKNVRQNLKIDGRYKNLPVTGFQLAGADGVYYNARTIHISGNNITITADRVEQPQYIRYCFTCTPQPNLYSDGLPVAPFRTDNFEADKPESEAVPYYDFPDPVKSAEEHANEINATSINYANALKPTEASTGSIFKLSGSGNTTGYLRFRVNVPLTETVNSVTLRLHDTDMGQVSGTVSFDVYAASAFEGSSITWNKQPRIDYNKCLGTHTQVGIMHNNDMIDITLDPSMVTEGEDLYLALVPTGYSYFNFDSEFDNAVLFVNSVKPAKSIEIVTPPTKTGYYEGESFDSTGMTVKAYYDDGTSKMVTSYTASTTALSADDTFVTISFAGVTATVPVTVVAKAVSSIEISTLPSLTSYTVGQFLSVYGGEITLHYNNGDKEVCPMNIDMVSGYDMSVPGVQTVTVTVGDFTATYEITVSAKVIKGDADGDGKIAILDALQIFKYISGKDVTPIESTSEFLSADCNNDGNITVLDALAVFKHIAGKEIIT